MWQLYAKHKSGLEKKDMIMSCHGILLWEHWEILWWLSWAYWDCYLYVYMLCFGCVFAHDMATRNRPHFKITTILTPQSVCYELIECVECFNTEVSVMLLSLHCLCPLSSLVHRGTICFTAWLNTQLDRWPFVPSNDDSAILCHLWCCNNSFVGLEAQQTKGSQGH